MSRGAWAVILAGILGACIACVCSHPSGLAYGQPVSPRAGEKNLDISPPKYGEAGREAARRWYEKPRAVRAAATTNTTMTLGDVALGKVIQVGTVKFVKVGDNQYLAENICPAGSTYSSFYKGCVVKTTTYSYTGDYQTFTAPATGTYVVELWGGQGGYPMFNSQLITSKGPVYGGFTSGFLTINNNQTLYLYIGGRGSDAIYKTDVSGGWNGGGGGCHDRTDDDVGSGGGGASDIRTTSGNWNNAGSLRSRIIVAAGGGGSGHADFSTSGYGEMGTHAGGLVSSSTNACLGSTQASGYQFGIGQTAVFSYANRDGGGGGGGWYGGCSNIRFSDSDYRWGGVGGSSYISGHTGCVAVTSTSDSTPKAGCTTGTTDNSCSISPYGYTFTNTVMIDGAGYAWTNVKGALTPMPDPTSVGAYYASGVGHQGNGAARITQLSVYLGI